MYASGSIRSCPYPVRNSDCVSVSSAVARALAISSGLFVFTFADVVACLIAFSAILENGRWRLALAEQP